MGVDIEWVDLPEDVRAARNTMLDLKGTDEPTRFAAHCVYASSDAYFQTAWGCLEDLAHVMQQMDMLCAPPQPAFPVDPAYDAIEAQIWPIREHILHRAPLPEGITAEQVETVRQHQHATDEVLARRPHVPARGIPAYKLSTNDAWVVHPDEIQTALTACEANQGMADHLLDNPHAREQWNEWVNFIRLAADHGGFRMG